MRTIGWLLLCCFAALGCATVTSGEFTPSRATLLSRAKYNDYEKSTFSFEHGVRDDPGLRITRNDWDVEFGNGRDAVEVTMVTDDCSRIIDLGPRQWSNLRAAELPLLPAYPTPTRDQPVASVEGHMYLVHTKDSDSDLLAVFRVERLIPGDSVEISWSLVGPTAATASGAR